MKLYRIIANETQLKVINDALESYSRLGIGQLEVVLGDLGFRTYDQFKHNLKEFHSEDVTKAINLLKQKLFSMSSNQYSSISNVDVHENFKIAYDIFSTIQSKLAEGSCKMSVYSNDSHKYSKNGILEIEVIEEGEINASKKK